MNKKTFQYFLFLVTFFSISHDLFSQRSTSPNSYRYRKAKFKYEVIAGLGGTNALTDLGGRNQIGVPFIKDFDVQATRACMNIGVRYKNSPFWAVKAGIYAGTLRGSDTYTKEPYRNNRNISFRSPVAELSVHLEGYLSREKPGQLYRIRGARGMRRADINLYGFSGIGVFYHNPKGFYDGKWYSLKKMGTEGQGLPGGPKKYSNFSIAFPIGFGMKYSINRHWSVGLEYGVRLTLTDYIDDTSTEYYDNNAINAAKGPVAAHFADPSKGNIQYTNMDGITVTQAGQQRGDSSENDSYMFLTFNVNYKLSHKKRTRAKF